jgi:serine phosphatase RsbU (regulator of sigma subunit)
MAFNPDKHQKSWLYRLVRRLRPELACLPPHLQLFAISQVTAILYLGPITLALLAWLYVISDWLLFKQQIGFILLVAVATGLLANLSFNLYMNVGSTGKIAINSSFAILVYWAFLLVFGTTVFWGIVLGLLLYYGRLSRQRRRLNEDAFWLPASFFCQGVGASLFSYLLGLRVYQVMGGAIPLTSLEFSGWLPALVAMFSQSLAMSAILLPLMVLWNHLMDNEQNIVQMLASFLLTLIGPSMIMAPFAIPVALLYTRGSTALFLFILAGILLVNWLAHHLSRSNERIMFRSAELGRLEALGEAIIQAPADGSTLPDLLTQHLRQIFPQDISEIYLRPPADKPPGAFMPPALRLNHPPEQPLLDEADWARLWPAGSAPLFIKKVIAPGMTAVYGDAVMVKITAVTPGEESGQAVCLGGLYLLRSQANGPISDAVPSLQTLASQIASTLYRAQVYAETAAHQKVKQELEFAGRIQATFLPRRFPELAGWDMAASLIPARETSGDFYDFIAMPDGRLAILVADVADKGTGAAIYMALSRTLVRTYALHYPDEPQRALQTANERILADTESEQFVTVFYALLEPDSGRLLFANAGHNPAYLFSPRRRQNETLGTTGPPLGMFDHFHWRQNSLEAEPGAVLLLYSDGVTEAHNAHNEEYGADRLQAVVAAHYGCTAQVIQTAILADVTAFMGTAPQFDDITLLVAVRTAPAISANPTSHDSPN